MTSILRSTENLPAAVSRSGVRPARAGILHLGPGAFFRAHLAAYTDDLGSFDWGIVTGGLRTADIARAFDRQAGLYTLLTRDSAGTSARVIGSVLAGVAPADLLSRMCDPAIRIVSLTITEKAYGLSAITGGLDFDHPNIAADLADPAQPRSAVGLIARALGMRRAARVAPFTPLSCDNLPGNGHVLRRLVIEFAASHDADLAGWIATQVPFPCTMIDRITPASTDATRADAAAATGCTDHLAVETEPFRQWVIEDRFATGRPDWDRAGALFVSDVAPYEKMKLRMLNGTHSLLAYRGFLAGHDFVRDAIADPAIRALAQAHLALAATTLDPVAGVDPARYAQDLIARFENRAILHRTAQIASDGTAKLPQRVFDPAVELLARGADAESHAGILAAWMCYATGQQGARSWPLNDPREAAIRAALAEVPRSAEAISDTLFALPGLIPAALAGHAIWRGQVVKLLALLL
jgi:fructuronate reductase